jgi:Holliday junction DNA helicase RuvA
MIVQLCGTLVSASPSAVVLDVGGVGYELGVSATTAASLPEVGTPGVTLLTRMVVREGDIRLYGFARHEERSLFDQLCQISGVGPKLALSVLSTYSVSELAQIALAGDAKRMSAVSGVGKKLASRLVLELHNAFEGDAELRSLAGLSAADAGSAPQPITEQGIEAEVTAALLQMGFTPQEAKLAVEGLDESGATTESAALAYALKRLGGGA